LIIREIIKIIATELHQICFRPRPRRGSLLRSSREREWKRVGGKGLLHCLWSTEGSWMHGPCNTRLTCTLISWV